MEGLVLGLWALLVSAEFGGGATEPGVNLSCYQCFKVSSQALCKPAACYSTDRVCVSNAAIVTIGEVRFLLSKRCAPRCPNANVKYEWLSGSGVLNSLIRQCCSGNLCNRAPAARGSPWALQRGFLLRVGLSLLWALL
ncbi:lymphocyte antigen 6L [Diceros bicornis minor]|uniref:lymphocyte antigen 6L n=1 Tax=Diceros bicornis minor TaxID=77932 RepID=UPI0026F24FEE|nr:lymphocyte antigen 6L [Diceros bicornis minor]